MTNDLYEPPFGLDRIMEALCAGQFRQRPELTRYDDWTPSVVVGEVDGWLVFVDHDKTGFFVAARSTDPTEEYTDAEWHWDDGCWTQAG